MYRMICAAAALLVAAAVQPATADDKTACRYLTGDEGIAACTRILVVNPKAAWAYYDRGNVYHDKGDYDRAIADYDQAIRIDPKHALAYNNRGNAYHDKGDHDRAIADFDQVIRLVPKYALAYNNRGLVYQDKGDYDRAIFDFDQVIRLVPNDAAGYTNRGNAYSNKGDYVRAISDHDQAIQLNPSFDLAYNNRGNAYSGKGDYDRATSDFDQAIRINPKFAFAYNNRGLVYLRKGDYDRAISDFDQAIRIDPKYAVAYANIGNAYSSKGDYDHAISALDEAVRLNPKRAVAYNNRGEAYEAKNDYDRAIADFDRALRLDPSFEEARRGRERVQVLLAKRSNPEAQANAPTSTAVPVAVAPSGRRIALVIGMSAYANVPPLRNPARDARSIADTFRRLGFAEVIEREDLSRAKLVETLRDFGDKAADADWAVVYYAGHGLEMNGENYLVPVDAKFARAEDVEDEAVTLKRVLSKAETAHKLRMVILDACRNNPFRMASADGRSRAIGRGLSPVEPARGVLVAYAARDGTTADDGDSEHSPFTQALLAHLETPGLEINLMFRKVRDQVLARTNNAQEPFTYGSLPGEELYFKQAVR
jgi:tetratricopeptide (TPR) repeat protein